MLNSLVHLLLVIAYLLLFSTQASWAGSGQLSEYEIKTAYLYNFAKYVDWPTASLPRESTSLTMCIAGKSPLNDVMETLAGKTVKNRRLAIRQLSRIDDLGDCNILFINAAAKTSLSHVLTSSVPRAILTISDSKGFASAGGMIELVPVRDKIRFEINNRTAQNAGLRISSHLLRLATTVIE